MFRRLLMTLVLLVTIPAAAHAWYVTGKMSPAGSGTITPNGMKSVSGTTGTSLVATAKPGSGYKISQVLIDNAKQNLPAPDASGTYSFPISYNGVFYRNFTVTYAPITYALSATVDSTGTGTGTVTTDPAGARLTGLTAGTAVKFVINAGSNSEIESLLVNGIADASAVGQTAFTRTLTVPADATLVAKFKVSRYTSIYNQCASCHSGQGSVPDIAPNFFSSKHWNNHLETGPEFTNQMDTQVNGGNVTFLGTYSDGYLNANDAYTTVENGSTVTCAYRCHFRPGMGPQANVPGYLADGKATATLTYTDTLNGVTHSRPGSDGCEACHDTQMTKPNYQNTCLVCHSGSKHGKVPNEFWGSKHWQNTLEIGPEFANQINTTVSGGNVKYGNISAGYLNANDSYSTTENGAAKTCAYRCHFRPGMGPNQDVAGYLADGRSTTYVSYTDTTGKYGEVGKVYTRPGGNACMACHDSHKLETSAQSTCYSCHAGGNHGWSVAAFEKSTHFTGTYAKLEGVANEACIACHNPHSTEAEFANMTTASILRTAGAATGCQKCHTPDSPYGIFNADLTGKAPHFQTGTPDAGGYYPTASYITAGGATCADCHYHNNSMNAGWAEGGHGKVDAAAFVSNASHNWNNQGTDGVNYQVSPQKTNCIRCHSASGFAQYWDSGFTNIGKVYLDPVAKTLDKASAPLVCSGCHTSFKGAVRPLPAGYAKVKAFYGYSTVSIAPAKMVVNLEFTDNKNSNICIPCHSQRASGTGIKALFAQGAFKQYSVGTAMYPHEAQPAAIVDGKGGYEFASAQGYQDRMRHIRIGNYGTGTGYNNTGITSGNCAGCHMTSAKTHALESVTYNATTGAIEGIASSLCVNCHPAGFTYQDIQKKKDNFNASVKALASLLVQKGFTQDGINVIAERKAFDMSRGTKDNAIAEKNIGAWFNWYLFNTADKAAYVHNPAYSRRLINDSIDWLDDNVMNDSAAATVQAQVATAQLTAQERDQALAQLNNPGCMGCHMGTGSTHDGEAVPGIEQAPHYNTNGAPVPGETFTQAQFVTPETQCNYCHGYGHGTDSPGGTILADYAESGHADINGLAWTDYDFKARATCNACHTTKGFVTAVNNGFTNTAAWGSASDMTKQVLGCNACHSSTAWATSVRNTGAYSAGMGGYGTAAVATISFDDVGQSNICIPCHASRENGATIKALESAGNNFTNVSFKNPHYLAAAAVFYGKGGFQFYTSGVRYNTYGAAGKIGKGANWSHGRLGMDNYSGSGNNDIVGASNNTGTGGQCVACHMGPNNSATLKGNHTFDAIEVAKSTNATGCYGCHKTNPSHAPGDIAALNEEELEIFERGMDFFKWQLEQVNMFYTESHPYFVTIPGGTSANAIKNWTQSAVTPVGPVGGSGAQSMGAAMNFKLLHAEKGAHVHNRAFARALIADSIVYLQNGTVGDRTVGSTDVNNIINFSNYSTHRTANPDSNPVSINALKGWLTRVSNGIYTRR